MDENQVLTRPAYTQIELIMDTIDRGIVSVDLSGNCTFINRAAAAMLGYHIDECLGKNLHLLIHHSYKNGEHYPEKVCHICNKVSNDSPGSSNDEVFWKKDNTSFDIRYTSNICIENDVPKGVVITFSDITEQKRKEARLRGSEKKYKYLFENNPCPMFIWDLETLLILDCNEEALEKYGYSREEFIGFNIMDMRPKEDIPLLEAMSLTAEKYGKVRKTISRHKKKSGEVMYVQVNGHLIDYNGRKASFLTINDLTEQKNAENALKESNDRFAYAAQATAQAIWEWNAKEPERFKEYGYKQLFGYDLPGNVGDVSFWASKVHPDDYQATWQHMNEVKANPNLLNWTIEYRFKAANDQIIYIKEKATLFRDENGQVSRMIGSMHDITRRKNEETHLKLLESVITNTNDAVLITKAIQPGYATQEILYVNDAFTKMTGYSTEEVIGKTPRILHGANTDRSELKRLSDSIKDRKPCEITIINYKKGGEEFWVNFFVSPVFDEKGNITHFISIKKDVTAQKKAEIELKLFADDLYKRNKELHQFAYIVSHNLRSPVANIIGISNLLELDKDDPETVEKCTEDLKRSIANLDNVIKDLSKILTITDGSSELIKENIILEEVFNDIKIDLNEIIQYSGSEIESSLGGISLFSNKPYLYSILYNLISNAIKYRSGNGAVVKINAAVIDQSVIIKVEDNGIGIDLEKHEEDLFKPYKRFTINVEGKGLGLFLVKSHVEALKGKLYIESKLGEGTVFSIILPNS